MDVVIASVVGVGFIGVLILLGFAIARDLKRITQADAYYADQRRLMARLEVMPFEQAFEFNRADFFKRIDEYRAGLDATR